MSHPKHLPTSRADIAGPNTWGLLVVAPTATEETTFQPERELTPTEQLAFLDDILTEYMNSTMDNTAKILHYAASVCPGTMDIVDDDGNELSVAHFHLIINTNAEYSDDILDRTLFEKLPVAHIERFEMPDTVYITEKNFAAYKELYTYICNVPENTDFIRGVHPDLFTPSGLHNH